MKYTLYLLLCIFLAITHPLKGQVISTYAGNGTIGYSGDNGPATLAQLDSPSSVITDAAGNIYFTDEFNNCVRKVDTTGKITTVAGMGLIGSSGDNGPATNARMDGDWGLALDGAGNLFITDQGNFRVRKVNPAGIISLYAGSSYGTSGDFGQATNAQFRRPIGIATDGAGNVFVGDQDAFTIKKITTAGIITNYAGINTISGYSGDGGAAIFAEFNATYGLATDNSGNVYICDADNNRVRKINSSGIISTIAGNGLAGFGGDGGPAVSCMLNYPTGVFIDNAGNILIADSHNNRIRRIDPSGVIHTIAGTGTMGFGGDGGLAINANLYHPSSVVADGNQNIYIVDYHNNRIRKISKSVSFTEGKNHNIHFCENTSSVSLDTLFVTRDFSIGLTDTWSAVYGPFHGTSHLNYSAPASGVYVTPSGLYYTPFFGYSGNDTIVEVVSNGYNTDTTTVILTIDHFIANAGTIVGDSTVCAGSTISLTDSVPGGIWTISNLNAIVSNGMVTGELAGLDTITYTVVNTCGLASISKIITVNPLPSAGFITGGNEVCKGATITLSETVSGGYWSQSNTHTLLYQALSICLVTGLTPGSDTIFYNVADSLCSNHAYSVVLVAPLPTAAISGGTPTLCVGVSAPVTGNPAGGSWQIANANASFAGSLLTAISPGPDTLVYSSANNCGIAFDSLFFEVDTLPEKVNITRVENVLYAPPGYSGYQWTFNGLPVLGATTDSFIINAAGVYAVIITNAFGCSTGSFGLSFPGCDPEDILLFPNPTESIIHISWCKKLTARVICMNGSQMKIIYNTTEIDLGDLPDADYLLALYDENGKKVLVKYIAKLK